MTNSAFKPSAGLICAFISTLLSNILPLSWHLQTTAVQNSVPFTRNLWVYLTSSHMWKQLTCTSENLSPIQMDRGQKKQQEREKVLVLVLQSHVFHAEKILLPHLLSLCIKPTKKMFLCLLVLYLRFQAYDYLYLLWHQTPSLTCVWTGFVSETVAQPGSIQTSHAAADMAQLASAWRNFV